jgi:hypothetical protein
LARLLDLTANDLWNELGDELVERAALCLPQHDVRHLLPDLPDLRAGGICGLLDLVLSSLGEGDAEETKEVLVSSLDNDVGFDQGLPLADKRSQLV